MGSAAFVQVRLPARHLVLGQATRGKGVSAQAIVESVPVRPNDRVFRVWAELHGFPEERMGEVATEIQARYGTVPSLAGGGRLVFDVHPRHVQDAFFGALLAVQASFGPPWLRVAGGRVTLRAQALGCEPRECAQRLEKALSLAQVPARVEVVELPDEELAAWQALEGWRQSSVGEGVGLLA